MKRWMLGTWLACSLVAHAGEGSSAKRPENAPAPEAPAAEEDEDGKVKDEDRVSGRAPPTLPREPRPAGQVFQLPANLTPEQFRDLPLPHKAYIGAEVLQLDPEFVNGVQYGIDLIYLRKYSEAREYFGKLETSFPGTGIRNVADVLVWQALMLENFDYRYDKQYWTASKAAKKDVEAALATPGNEGWDHLMMAALLGIESIHTMRQGGYLNALQMAFQAMDHIEKCRAAAPEFIDLKLADGLYNYWRSVITMNSKMLPDFGDHRVEGIEQMQVVEDQGVFVAPMATLSLAFTWIEEGDLKRALTATSSNRSRYPDNIVNNLVAGTVYIYLRRYADAIEVFDHVAKVDPNNQRVHYWKGLALLRQGQLDGAASEFQTYLKYEFLEPYQKSYTHYRLGQVQQRQKEYGKAAESYAAAVKVDGNKAAKSALERLEQRKKEGKITW